MKRKKKKKKKKEEEEQKKHVDGYYILSISASRCRAYSREPCYNVPGNFFFFFEVNDLPMARDWIGFRNWIGMW